MKILIISAVFPPEPIVSARISYDLASELSKTNIVTVICPTPSRPLGFKFPKADENLPFNIHVLDSHTCPESNILGRIRENLSFGLRCRNYIEKNHKDIDTIYMNVWPLFSQYIIVKCALKFHIKKIIHIQDIYPESFTNKLPTPANQFFRWLLTYIDKYILQKSDLVIAISDRMKEYLSTSRSISHQRIEVVTNWQDEKDFMDFQAENIQNVSSKKLTFMYLGNIGPVAGVEFLIDSFGKARIPYTRLIIAGSGSMKANCEELSRLYPYAEIIFVDVPSGKVPEIQAQADVMLLPVKKGGALSSIPSKLPAYMFSKKPIIGCVDLTSDTADSIISSKCGWVIEPENREKLIELLKTISNESPESREKKGLNGFNYAIEKFSKINNLKKITDLITKLI